jgi:tetratricopeptide (TPR) repeat protein
MISPIPSSRAPLPDNAGLRHGPLAAPRVRSELLGLASPSATADHLGLIKAMLQAGQHSRALELLEMAWPYHPAGEQAWYFRLWALTGMGRVLEALELARIATGRLPGSSAVAYFHAALERAAGEPAAAVEAALRAAAIAPGRPETEALLARILEPDEAGPARLGFSRPADGADVRDSKSPGTASAPSPLLAALAGQALLHPLQSNRAVPPLLPGQQPPEAPAKRAERDARRRFLLMAGATLFAAVWAGRHPLLASAALAAVVAWLGRSRRERLQ